MAAGPDEVRGTGPYQDFALRMRLEFSGSAHPTARPFVITSSSPSRSVCGRFGAIKLPAVRELLSRGRALPRRITAQTMRAVLIGERDGDDLAQVAAPTWRAPIPRPWSCDCGHGVRMATAPAIISDLMYLSPRLLIAAQPLLAARGVLARQPAPGRPRTPGLNGTTWGEGTDAASAVALISPTPGMVASR